jgi:hypothetical protein
MHSRFVWIVSCSLVLAVLSLSAACGGGGGSGDDPDAVDAADVFTPSQVVSAAGVVEAPSGVDPGALRVLGVAGAVEVDASGAFDATLFDDGVPGLLLAVDADDNLVLMGFGAPGGDFTIDTHSTALALLHIASGGILMPAELTERFLAALDATAAVDDLEAALATALAADPLAVTNGSDELAAAIAAATAALLELFEGGAEGRALRAVAEQAMGLSDLPTNIRLEPSADTPQSGVRMVHGDESGVAAQNEYRRVGQFAVYQTATEGEDGEREDVDPPMRVGELHDIPATGRLDIASVAVDIVTFDAPFSPELSPSVNLALAEGSTKTYYDLIVLGPTLMTGDVPPIFLDSRYFGESDAWDDAIVTMAWETFFVDYFVPVAFTLITGNAARIRGDRVRAAVQRFRGAADPVLARNGIFIPLVEGGSTIRFLMEELAGGGSTLRTEMIEVARQIFASDAARTAAFEEQLGRLQSAARAAAVLAAIQGLMTVGDISVVTTHLRRSRRAEVWQATMVGARVRVEPSTASVTRSEPAEMIRASVSGAPDGDFVFKWRTTGHYGEIFSLLDGGGTSVETDEDEVQYIADFLALPNDDRYLDTVSVEVYSPEGDFIGSGAAEVRSGEDIPIGQSCQVTLPVYNAPAGWDFGQENPNDVTCEMDVEGTWVLDPSSFSGCITSASCSGECEYGEGSSIGYPIQWQTYDTDGNPTGGNHCGAPGGVGYSSCGAPIVWTQRSCVENYCESLREDTEGFNCAACNCACGGGNCYPWTGPGSITFSAFVSLPCEGRCDSFGGPPRIAGGLSFRIVNCAAVNNRLPNCPGNVPEPVEEE